jgi:hypothetical protein
LGLSPEIGMDDGIAQVRSLIEEGRVRDLTAPQFSNFDSLRPYLQQDASPLGRELHVAHLLAAHRKVA